MDLAKAIVKVVSVRVLRAILAFVGLAIFARELGSFQLGVFFLFQGVIQILMLPADLGLTGALEKRISEGNAGPEFLSSALILKAAPIVLIIVGIFLFKNELSNFIGVEIFIVLSIGLVIEEAYRFVYQLLKGELRVEKAANMILIRQFIWVSFGYLSIVLLEMEALGLIYSYILGSFLAFLWGFKIRRTSFGTPSVKACRSLFDYAKFDWISGAGGTLFNWFDVVLIGVFLSQTEVGAYETAWRLSSVTVMFGVAVRAAIFPQFSSWSDSEEEDRISKTLPKMIIAAIYFVIPSFVGAVILSRELLGLIFGQEFVIAATALIILLGYRLVQGANQTVGKTLQAIDHVDLAAYAMIVGVLANLLMNVALLPLIGIAGAAFATFVSFGLMVAIRSVYLSRFIDFQWPIWDIIWCATAAVIMGVVLQLVKSQIPIDTVTGLISIVIIGAVIYISVTLLSPSFRSIAKDQFHHLTN